MGGCTCVGVVGSGDDKLRGYWGRDACTCMSGDGAILCGGAKK